MKSEKTPSGERPAKGADFVRRMYVPRIVGTALSFLCIASALYPLGRPLWVWTLALVNGFVWAHLAYQLSRRSPKKFLAERRNMMVDSLAGGFFAGVVGLNPAPACAVLGILCMNNIATGGLPLFLRGCTAQLSGVLIALVVFTPVFVTTSTSVQLWVALPLLVIYPWGVGLLCYGLTVKLSQNRKVLKKLSRTDSLTELLNHGAWKDLLQVEFLACQTLNRLATVALIDIDYFKNINDTYGHIAGDAVLKRLAVELMKNLRDTDIGGRYGGDEFCAILPDTSLSQAMDILERLRLTVSNYQDVLIPDLSVSLSIGVAAYDSRFENAGVWLNEADQALYAAKKAGRNKVSFAVHRPTLSV